MKFPLFNISIENWNDENVEELFLFDAYVCQLDEAYYKRLFLNKQYVDEEGKIYVLVGMHKRELNWFQQLFIRTKYEFEFKPLDKTMSLEDLKNVLLQRIPMLEGEEGKAEWIDKIEKATRIAEAF